MTTVVVDSRVTDQELGPWFLDTFVVETGDPVMTSLREHPQPGRRPERLIARWVPDPRAEQALICTWVPPIQAGSVVSEAPSLILGQTSPKRWS